MLIRPHKSQLRRMFDIICTGNPIPAKAPAGPKAMPKAKANAMNMYFNVEWLVHNSTVEIESVSEEEPPNQVALPTLWCQNSKPWARTILKGPWPVEPMGSRLKAVTANGRPNNMLWYWCIFTAWASQSQYVTKHALL